MWSGLRAHRYGHLDRLGECQAWSRSAWRNYPTVVNFSFRSFWKCDVSSKVLTFSWRLILDKLPTRVALVRRGIMVEDGGCVFCGVDKEDSQHLFLGCTFSFLDLVLDLSLVGYLLCNIERFQYFISCNMVYFFRDKRMHRAHYLIWSVVCWSLWFNRNCIIFHEKLANAQLILWQIQNLSWS